MILDKELVFSDAQAVTSTGDTNATNDVDLVVGGDAEKQLHLQVSVNEAVASGGAATVEAKLITDDNPSFSSPKTVMSSGEVALADLGAGAKLILSRIAKTKMERYLRLVYTVGTAALTAGKFDAFMAVDVDNPLV